MTGGFALGAYWAGMKFKNHFFSEVDKYCIELYQKRFPDSISLGDITKIESDNLIKKYGNKWIISGGFPCQDISIAGKRKGLIDEEGNKTRSGLWFDYWELIRVLRPEFVLIENVFAILNKGLDTVLATLAEIGYNAEWQIISAEDMGAPHKRERCWIVAYSSSRGWGLSTNSELCGKRISNTSINSSKNKRNMAYSCEDGSQTTEQKRNDKKESNGKDSLWVGTQRCCSDMADTDGKGLSESTCPGFGSIQSQVKSSEGGESCRRNATTRGNWSVEPSMGCMVNGLPYNLDRYEGRLSVESYKRKQQLMGLGNSIVPQIAELLFRQIKNLL